MKDAHRPSTCVAGMDRLLADILDRCLEVDPSRRLRMQKAVLGALARRERQLDQRPLIVFGFVAHVVLCIVLGSLGILGRLCPQSAACRPVFCRARCLRRRQRVRPLGRKLACCAGA